MTHSEFRVQSSIHARTTLCCTNSILSVPWEIRRVILYSVVNVLRGNEM